MMTYYDNSLRSAKYQYRCEVIWSRTLQTTENQLKNHCLFRYILDFECIL